MISSIKSEFRKLLSVRSTYVIVALATALVVFFAFYTEGIRVTQASLHNSGLLANETKQAIVSVGLLGSLVGVLLVTHEYRYNTIMYTLTASRSRTRTLLAKLLVISCFALAFSLFVGVLSPIMTWLGVQVKGLHLVPQSIPIWDLLWKTLFVGWGFSMLAFIFAVIIRIQVGAISTMFLVPAMAEPLLGLLLKHNAVYLPYNSVQAVIQKIPAGSISPGRAASVVLIYLAIGCLASWILFLRRDAS